MATRKAAAKKKAPAKKKVAAKKAPAKKAPAKKAAPARKAPAKKAPAAKAAPARKTTALKDKLTKTQIVGNIAESTGLSKKQVSDVMVELEALIERSIKKRSVGEFTLPGLMKITTVKKPARKARKGINPFTGEETVFKAKPASVAVKVRPLKKMKEFADS
ncbi:HU family DNA-binding protein [Pseudohaliea sp.]|uniref:HU family DNA-binding protein n=1 Tax=Pseudohaliea sp. TaxID=2740289 RepID=UPI0032EB6BF8